ncbi:MAG TPA: hypothetical protein VF838_17495 [Trebonia sp.]
MVRIRTATPRGASSSAGRSGAVTGRRAARAMLRDLGVAGRDQAATR